VNQWSRFRLGGYFERGVRVVVHPVESGECSQLHFVVMVVSPTVVVFTEDIGNSMLNADRAIIAPMTNATTTMATRQKRPMASMSA
jgi:hypothetical protein